MNAPDLLARLRKPDDAGQSLVLRLKTLTPLYTGGVGQHGDLIHPSNLLGGLRHMSCLVARTLGDAGVEQEVWGNAGDAGQTAAAKKVALHWDTSGLERITLPTRIPLPKREDGKVSAWYFNTAFQGGLVLRLTRNGISDLHWNMLRMALTIQLRHGSFGSKDQFGLGVLAQVDDTPVCAPLDATAAWPIAVCNEDEEKSQLNLLRYGFVKLRFEPKRKQPPKLDLKTRLLLGLSMRAALRNALRAAPEAPQSEQQRLTTLRHQMLGKLNESGSAINVSAAYGDDKEPELRIAIAFKPQDASARKEILTKLRATLDQFQFDDTDIGYRPTEKSMWEFGGAQANKKAAWLNKLAGVGA